MSFDTPKVMGILNITPDSFFDSSKFNSIDKAIKQVELITNPSAKYNPEGMSGIINIVLHKNVKMGVNGSASVGLTYEKQAKFNGSLDLNYRNGKFNIYGNYANNVSKNENYGNIYRPDDNSEQNFFFLDDSKSNIFKAGLDFYLNEKNKYTYTTDLKYFYKSIFNILTNKIRSA